MVVEVVVEHKTLKHQVQVVKVVEVPIAVIALFGFWTGNLWLTMTALIALTCQSAFFGPAKYGMIPELVEARELSRANGSIKSRPRPPNQRESHPSAC